MRQETVNLSKKVMGQNISKIRLSGANFSSKCGAVALKLKGAVALMRWRENFS